LVAPDPGSFELHFFNVGAPNMVISKTRGEDNVEGQLGKIT
jgi:hypothetical protein